LTSSTWVSHIDRNDPAVRWLLESEEPTVRYLTLTEVLDEAPDSLEVKQAKDRIPSGRRVRALLKGQRRDGGFGVHPYQKWTGAHWRLVSLVELGFPAREPRALAAIDQVLRWLTGDAHRRRIMKINGLTRRCASQEGNALAVCSRLGATDDERVTQLARSLSEWQWPDGGWNCDKDGRADHSSFYESLAPLWGLVEYYRATGDEKALETAKRASEFFLNHRLFRSDKTGEVINPEWIQLHYPLYWHYDILQALRVLALLGRLNDSRVQEALGIVESKRLSDNRWKPEGYYWRQPGKRTSGVEVVDWGRNGPNEMITLNALHVLKLAGRLH
jgi:hypothetical protein